MKQTIFTFLLALALGGCSAAPAAQTAPPSSPAGETAPTPQDAATLPAQGGDPVVSARPAQGELMMVLEGMEERVPATLHTGPGGCSLYIPQTGWTESAADDTARSYQSLDNDLVRLTVQDLGAVALDEARQAVQEATPADWLEGKQGDLVGQTEEGLILEVRFFLQGGGSVLAVICQYPEEAAEGFGVRLSVMADSFQADP